MRIKQNRNRFPKFIEAKGSETKGKSLSQCVEYVLTKIFIVLSFAIQLKLLITYISYFFITCKHIALQVKNISLLINNRISNWELNFQIA